MEKVFEIYIKTTPERLWEAITDTRSSGRSTTSASGVAPTGQPGSSYESFHPGAGIAIAEGENLEVDAPRRLVQSFTALWSDDVKNEGTSRVTWEIEPVGDSCRLTVTHDQLRDGANDELYGGWPMILSGLKTLLETGELLTTPGSLRYSGATAPDFRWSGRRAAPERQPVDRTLLVVAQARLVVREEDLPDQIAAAAHAGLLEDALEMLLDGVGRDAPAAPRSEPSSRPVTPVA